jgi:hypothetical protein
MQASPSGKSTAAPLGAHLQRPSEITTRSRFQKANRHDVLMDIEANLASVSVGMPESMTDDPSKEVQ